MNRIILIINDIIWLITAITCVLIDEHPVITVIVVVTTIIYALDLWAKLAKLNYRLKPFFRQYWLDIVFLIPFCKLCRGFRIFKVGRMLRIADATCDFTEMAFRGVNAVKHIKNHDAK